MDDGADDELLYSEEDEDCDRFGVTYGCQLIRDGHSFFVVQHHNDFWTVSEAFAWLNWLYMLISSFAQYGDEFDEDADFMELDGLKPEILKQNET